MFESALDDYRTGLIDVASRSLIQLVRDGSQEPLHLSYCGLLLALNEGRFEESLRLCERAAHQDGRRSPELYSNWAQVLSLSGRRRQAIDTLTEGLSLHQHDARLRKELQHLIPRARPAFPRLGRRHPVNKYFGLARSLSGRLLTGFIPSVRRVDGPPPATR